MTTTSPPDITANVRAEVARTGTPVSLVLARLPMTETTWYRRMENPGTWRWGELVALARVLDVPVARLVS